MIKKDKCESCRKKKAMGWRPLRETGQRYCSYCFFVVKKQIEQENRALGKCKCGAERTEGYVTCNRCRAITREKDRRYKLRLKRGTLQIDAMFKHRHYNDFGKLHLTAYQSIQCPAFCPCGASSRSLAASELLI